MDVAAVGLNNRSLSGSAANPAVLNAWADPYIDAVFACSNSDRCPAFRGDSDSDLTSANGHRNSSVLCSDSNPNTAWTEGEGYRTLSTANCQRWDPRTAFCGAA
jgi:hypothetical protein